MYVKDWLASTRVAVMTPAEEGGYFRLLCHAWNDSDCCLPDDDETLALLSRLGGAWTNGSGMKIRACFVADKERPGKIFNERQRAVLYAQLGRQEESRERGKKAANARWKKNPGKRDDASALPEHCASNATESSEHVHGDASSPVPRPSSPDSRERAANAERPSVDEVKFYAQTIGLAEWKTVDWFDEMQGGGWLDFSHRPIIDWKAVLRRVTTKWEADGRPSHPPSAGRRTRNGSPSSKSAPDHSKGF
jgi:uncharacterized protein YdaU (DUF1376 family)